MPDVRYPTSLPSALTAAQRAAHDRIVAGRGKLPRPYTALLASPRVAELVNQLSQELWHGALPTDVLEAVFLSVARTQRCDYQWQNHLSKALDAGVSQDSVDAIQGGRIPEQPPHLNAALRFVEEMQDMKRTNDASFAAVVEHFGAQGLAELCAFLGFATTISVLLNVQSGATDAAASIHGNTI
jgi:4-carboxymuconolactone decarboxylase